MKQIQLAVVIEAPETWTDEQVWEELDDLVNNVIEDTEITVLSATVG